MVFSKKHIVSYSKCCCCTVTPVWSIGPQVTVNTSAFFCMLYAKFIMRICKIL